jgi:predicted KAP-like P-loop ATPase
MSPALASLDLRGALYVSREHAPLITPEDRLSSEGAEILSALLSHPEMAQDLSDRLTALQRAELSVILNRLLERSRQVSEWGVPPELEACLAVTRADPSQGNRLAAFLSERPVDQLTAAIVQKISNEDWAESVFCTWKTMDVPSPVKKAIKRLEQDGNITV